LSVERQVISGVPQGSVLGPILFLLYINDIDTICCGATKFTLFADDLKLYSDIDISSTANSNLDLQSSLDKLVVWSSDWQLCINIDKCSVLGLHGRTKQSSRVYLIRNIILQGSNPVRDLGVLIDETLSYKEHIMSIVNKAMQRVGVLFRGFVCRDLEFMRRAFVTYIRPLLEFNSIVWSPTKKKYIDLIERVQRKFTKRIPCLQSMCYLERLSCINLQSLELRRLHFDLFYYYKIMKRLTPTDPDVFFTYHVPLVSLRQSAPFIEKPRNASDSLLSTFAYRSINCWNFLSNDVKSLSSLPAFKKAVNNLDLNSFLYGSCFINLSDFSA
jgi:hypothetical protein